MERGGRGGGGGVRRELFSTRALPVIKRGRREREAFRLFKFYICRPMGAETSPALSLSLSLPIFFRSRRGARRNWKRPRAKVTLFNVVSSKKDLSLSLGWFFFLFSFMKR